MFGVMPYVALKCAWVAGIGWGVRDRTIIDDPTFVAANVVTLFLDLLVVGLVLALLERLGRVGGWVPRWLLVVVAWTGSGLLVGATLGAVGAAVVGATSGLGTAADGLAPWVYVVVYIGFACQAAAVTGAGAPLVAVSHASGWKGFVGRSGWLVAVASTAGIATAVLMAVTAAYPVTVVGAGLSPLARTSLGLHAGVLLVASGSLLLRAAPSGQWWTWAQRLAFITTGVATSWAAYDLALSVTVLDQGRALILVHAVRLGSALLLTLALVVTRGVVTTPGGATWRGDSADAGQ